MLNDNGPVLTDIFAALGDPIRFGLIERLLAEGEVAAGDLSAGFGVSGPAISRHLTVLRNAGLVHRRVDRQRRLYSVQPDALRTAATWIATHRAFWDGSLTRLDALMAFEEKRHAR